jgi:hypothetical protein
LIKFVDEHVVETLKAVNFKLAVLSELEVMIGDQVKMDCDVYQVMQRLGDFEVNQADYVQDVLERVSLGVKVVGTEWKYRIYRRSIEFFVEMVRSVL